MRPAALAVLAAVALGCTSPMQTAVRETERTTRILRTLDDRLQRHGSDALKLVAQDEGARLGAELAALGCTLGASQPVACAEVEKAGRERYEARAQAVMHRLSRADQAVVAAWAALRLVTTALEDIDISADGEHPALVRRLAALMADLPRIIEAAKSAYAAVQAAITGVPQ